MKAMPPEELYPRVRAMIDAVLALEKGRTFQVGGQRIFPSEVHLLLDIARRPAATVTDLAASLGVTKGAVSQTLSRLEAKGLVVKDRKPDHGNALSLDFTDRGRKTVAHFQGKTARLRKRVADHLGTLTGPDRKAVAGFLAVLTGALEELADGE